VSINAMQIKDISSLCMYIMQRYLISNHSFCR